MGRKTVRESAARRHLSHGDTCVARTLSPTSTPETFRNHTAVLLIHARLLNVPRSLRLSPALMREISLAAPQLLVVLVGIPGSGKSTFAARVLEDIAAVPTSARWQRISQDTMKRRRKCIRAAERALEEGDHVLIDRCNVDAAQREHWLNLRGAHNTHRVAVYFESSRPTAVGRVLNRIPHEDSTEARMVERKLRGIAKEMSNNLTPPTISEGFHEVHWCRLDDSKGFEFARRRLRTLLLAAATRVLADDDEIELPSQDEQPSKIDYWSAYAENDPRVANAERRQREFAFKAKRIDALLMDQQEAAAADAKRRR